MKTHWPRPDFLPTAHRPPWLAWLWLVSAVLVLGTVMRDGLALQAEVRVQEQAQLKASNQRLTRTKRTMPDGTTRDGTTSAAAVATNARTKATVLTAAQNNDAAVKASTLVQQLGHPWGRILYTLESETPPGMQWLLFDHNAASPELRFEGLAPSSDMVLETVNRLSARRGWSEVVLSRLQAPDTRALTTPDASAPTSPKAKPLAPAAQPPSPLWRFEIRASVDPRMAVAAGDRSLDSR